MLFRSISYDWGNNTDRTTGITVGNNSWNYCVLSFTETIGTPANNARVYLNGTLVLTTTIKHSVHTNQLMIAEANSNQWFSGDVAQASVYNRVLSASEIQQNFAALRGRYGI